MARFLVVDDDPAAARGLALLLSGDGHEVRSFTDGADAACALADEPFDVVLTDHRPPRVDAHAIVRAVREHRPHACIVVMTARRREDTESLAAAGSCLVMEKPLRYDEVAAAVADCRARLGAGTHPRCWVRESEELLPLRRR